MKRAARKSPDRPERPAEPMGKVLEFMQLLWAVDHGLTQLSKRMRTTMGITGPQRLVVRFVGRQPGISAGELAEILKLHPSTLTGVLQRLTERGLLVRSVDEDDARRTKFTLTPAGWRLDATRAGTVEWVVRRAMAACKAGDLEATARVLRVLASSL